MRYVEDGIDSLKDKEAQTDLDPLKDKVKVWFTIMENWNEAYLLL